MIVWFFDGKNGDVGREVKDVCDWCDGSENRKIRYVDKYEYVVVVAVHPFCFPFLGI